MYAFSFFILLFVFVISVLSLAFHIYFRNAGWSGFMGFVTALNLFNLLNYLEFVSIGG